MTIAVAAPLLLAGCTIGPAEDEPTDAATAPATTTTTTANEESSDDGPRAGELSAQLFAAAAAAEEAEPLDATSGTLLIDVELTVEVAAVDRVTEGTLVELRLSAADEEAGISPQEFASSRFGAIYFIRDVYLDDPDVTGTRYRPLQFEDHRDACVCPTLPRQVGPNPQTVYALFPSLPEAVETVHIRLADSGIVIEDVPVAG